MAAITMLVQFRIPPELYGALKLLKEKTGQSLNQIGTEALQQYVAQSK